MKKARIILAIMIGAVCFNIAANGLVMADDYSGPGSTTPLELCKGGGWCYNVVMWVRIKNSQYNYIHDIGGTRIEMPGRNENVSACKGQDLYILAVIYHSGSGSVNQVSWGWDGAYAMSHGGSDGNAWTLSDRSSGSFYPHRSNGEESIHVRHSRPYGIADATTKETGSELANYIASRAFDGAVSYASLSDAKAAYSKEGAIHDYPFYRTSELGWFCSPGDGTTEDEPLREETKFDGQTTVSYKYGGKTYGNGDTVAVKPNNFNESVTVTPTFSHCLKKTEGAKEASTNWKVPANSSGGLSAWGNKQEVSSNCQGVKSNVVTKEIKTGSNEVKVCQELGFYGKAVRTGTRTIKKSGGKIVSSVDSWGNWSVDTSSWTTRKACITFKYPYYYRSGKYTYTGEVTGKTDSQTLRGCEGVVSTSGGVEKDCFIKSENPTTSGTTTVSFQDKLKRTGGESGEWSENSDYDGRSGEFGDVSVLGSNWVVSGINPGSGRSGEGVVKKYESNKEDETIELGYSLSRFNNLTWDKTVEYVKRSDGKYLVTKREGRESAQVTFNLFHPYNYDTSVNATIQGDLYVGTTGKASVSASYKARKNDTVTGNSDEYRTALPTHAGRYYAVFTVDSAAASAVKELTKDGGTTFWERDNNNPNDLCGVVKRGVTGVKDCEQNEIGMKSQIDFKVPDDYGAKVCVVAGVNYADSHGAPDSTITAEMNKGVAAVPNQTRETAKINSLNWRVSWAACESVKAKPRVQNWNAGFYTEGKVNMSVENKVPGQGFSLGNATDVKTFGSWSETSFIQGKDSTGFASSSKLGGTGMSDYSFCKSSPVSIANVGSGATCTAATSKLTASGITSATADTVAKTLMRYMPSAKDLDGGSIDKSGKLAEVGGKEPGVYEYHAGNADIGEMMVNLKNNSTKIIIVRGTARIKGNICVGGGTCSSNGSLIIKDRNDEKVSNIVDLANVVIIADKIEISPDVTQIDAILMALGNGGVEAREMKTSGEIDTCSGLDKTNEKVQACMKTLYVNGPVFAGKLKLNRTIYKTGEGKNITPAQDLQEMGSATAAEVFNLNPYVYMWAFEQASRYTQAETVYTQELAPRL